MPDARATASLIAFENRQIRRQWRNNEWWFSVVDVVGVLTDSAIPRRYWSDLKRKIEEEQGRAQLYDKIVQLKLLSSDGKAYSTDCATIETMLRIIQSIPSPKAEPFKQWLAKVSYERLQEIENPELATRRVRALYKAKGYADDWIDKRMRGMAVHEKLVNEWEKRGVKDTKEYAVLMSEIAQAAFGVNPDEHKAAKNLEPRHDLRDHMSDLELIFMMLGEASTAEIAQIKDAQGFDQNRQAAIEGGSVAGKAREQLEHQTGRKVASKGNYLPNAQKLTQKKG